MKRALGLATDLYQLTMAAGYFANDSHQTATFELFVRRLPPSRAFLIAAGLEQALEYLSELSFTPEEVAYLKSLTLFNRVPVEFFDYLASFRFSGEVWAMPEGTPFFPNEPILRVTAPIIEAQLLETYLLSTVNFQTMIASKAARIVEAADGRGVVEFGSRRAHGMDAGLYAARAAFIGGCVGTSNVEAGFRFGIPVSGTMAHSWVMSFPSEKEAFAAYMDLYPETAVFLIDTYDTLQGAKLATGFGPKLKGVRLDSGDLAGLSQQVRTILDEAGLHETKILLSGDLDETSISSLLASASPADLFGVGTTLSTSKDAPSLGGVYKLVEQTINGRSSPIMKLSEGKSNYPGAKQVWRKLGDNGYFSRDIVAATDESFTDAAPLLECVMRQGQAVKAAVTKSAPELREYSRKLVSLLPPELRRLENGNNYPVEFSPGLARLRAAAVDKLKDLHGH